MTVRELLETLQRLPRDAELLAFEAGCRTTASVRSTKWNGKAAGSTSTSAPVETTATLGNSLGPCLPLACI